MPALFLDTAPSTYLQWASENGRTLLKCALTLWISLKILRAILRVFWPTLWMTRSLANVPGPKPLSKLLGHQMETVRRSPGVTAEEWHDAYGPTIRLARPFGVVELSTVDPAALSFIYRATDERFVKPAGMRQAIAANVGDGVLAAEGHAHRRHRRVLNPAFGWPQIRDMLPRMWEKGYELRDKMLTSLGDPFYLKPEKACDDVPSARVMDMFGHLSNAALDIIGLVAIGEDLGALSDRQNDLRTANQDVLRVGFITDWLTVLRFAVPITRKIPTERGRVVKRSRETVEAFGHKVIAEKRRLLQDMHAGRLEKKTDIGKDVLSLLIKANSAADLREDQRLNDAEVIAQITTMLFTGHETTSTATGFCLRQLALNQQAQEKLRREVLEAGSDEPDFETLMALPYLHNVVRESLRFEGPVPNMGRVATENVTIPLSQPIVGRDGKVMDSVHLKRGDYVQAPYQAANRLTDVWGEDAREFRPERWEQPNFPHKKMPGVWGELATFGGGPHNCIGHRMAVLEMKVLLYVMLRNFKFEPVPSGPVIKPKWMIIQRCVVEGEEARGPQLPLLVRPLEELTEAECAIGRDVVDYRSDALFVNWCEDQIGNIV